MILCTVFLDIRQFFSEYSSAFGLCIVKTKACLHPIGPTMTAQRLGSSKSPYLEIVSFHHVRINEKVPCHWWRSDCSVTLRPWSWKRAFLCLTATSTQGSSSLWPSAVVVKKSKFCNIILHDIDLGQRLQNEELASCVAWFTCWVCLCSIWHLG